MPVKTVKNPDDIENLRDRVRKAAVRTRRELATIPDEPMEALHLLKLAEFGYDPLKGGRRLNLIEQLNQTFTNMATLAAAQRLLKRFPKCRERGLSLRLGTSRGRDIESIGNKLVEAEVFAAVRPSNNSKLSRDIDNLLQTKADNRFVFLYCPAGEPSKRCVEKAKNAKIEIWPLTMEEVM